MLSGFSITAIHYAKNVRIWSFSGPYFPELGINKEIYSVNLRKSPKAGKDGPEKLQIRTLFMLR